MRRFLFVRMTILVQTACNNLALTRCHPEEAESFARERLPTKDLCFSPRFSYLYLLTNRSKTSYAGMTGNLETAHFRMQAWTDSRIHLPLQD